jgi:hypothetical protein
MLERFTGDAGGEAGLVLRDQGITPDGTRRQEGNW